MKSSSHLVLSLLVLYLHTSFIASEVLLHESKSTKKYATDERGPILARHPSKDLVVPLQGPTRFGRPTVPQANRPERKLHNVPKAPSLPILANLDSAKSGFIRGGFIRVVSMPPEKRLTVAPITTPPRGPRATQTFKVSVRVPRSDIVRRQEPIYITPPPEQPFIAPPPPDITYTYLIGTDSLGHTTLIPISIPWHPGPNPPIVDGNKFEDPRITENHRITRTRKEKTTSTSPIPAAQTVGGLEQSNEDLMIDSPPPLVRLDPNTNPGNPQDDMGDFQFPEVEPKPFRRRRRGMEKQARRNIVRRG
ncbi:hypothetical protein TWF281_000096 [Arthrobotrys megalospora]